MSTDSVRRHRTADTFVRLAAAGVMSIAAGALAGWRLDITWLTTAIPNSPAMNPVTACTLIACAGALAIRGQRTPSSPRLLLARALSVLATVIGGLISLDLCFGWRLELDGILFSQKLLGNRMALNTAIAVVSSGVALSCLDVKLGRRFFPAELGAAFSLASSVIAVMGYAYGPSSYGVAHALGMSINTAGALVLLNLGILAARPGRGLTGVVLGSSAGGVMLRRLLPAGVAIPLGLGWLRIEGASRGYFSADFGLVLLIAFVLTVLLAILFATAVKLNRIDELRAAAAAEAIQAKLVVRDLYENAPCGYHALDAEGRILEMNATERSWLGGSGDELTGKLFAELLSPDTRERFIASFARFKDGLAVHELEFCLERPAAAPVWLSLKATAVRDAHGMFIRSRAVLTDVSDRKEADAKIQAINEELERRVAERTAELATTNRDLSERNSENETFVYAVSHDLRSPLVNLEGFSREVTSSCAELQAITASADVDDALRTRLQEIVDGDLSASVRFIQRAVSRLSGKIDALLSLSRAGRLVYDWQVVDVQSLVGQIVESLAAQIFERGVAVDVRDLPRAWGDLTTIEQIFANLIVNAINYLDPDRAGHIEIGCRGQDGELEDADGQLIQFYVRDNGLGIPAEHQSKLFVAFQRLHADRAPGEGMGLTLVKRAVERHGGQIFVESEVGAGTTFFFSLPAPTANLAVKSGSIADECQRSPHPISRR